MADTQPAPRAPDLHIRVTDNLLEPGDHRRIEVLDGAGNVLGDLANCVVSLTWKAEAKSLGLLVIKIAAERATVDSMRTP